MEAFITTHEVATQRSRPYVIMDDAGGEHTVHLSREQAGHLAEIIPLEWSFRRLGESVDGVVRQWLQQNYVVGEGSTSAAHAFELWERTKPDDAPDFTRQTFAFALNRLGVANRRSGHGARVWKMKLKL